MPSHILKNILILPSVFERWGRRGVGAVSADVSFRSGAGRSSRIPDLLSACSWGFGLMCQKTVESYGTVTSFFREHGVGFLKNAGCFSITDPPGSEPSPGFFTSALFRGPMRTSYKGEGGAGRADGWGGRGALFSERFPLPPQISLTPTPQPARRKPKRLKQYDARGGGKVDAADFAFDGDADMMRREPDHFGRQP